jgi:hypothetical protein
MSEHPGASDIRCAVECAARGEPMAGTASTVRSWLLLENPGPWGIHALRDGRIPGGVGEELRRRSADARVRVVMIRRPGRDTSSATTAFAIRSGPEEPWIERLELERFEDAIAIDLDRLGRGEPLGHGERHHGAVFLVCTHGRHDPCCAELGRPLATALAAAFPEETWESSHIGGDRFAGNLLVFPYGVYFGRVGPSQGPAVARSYLEGRLDLAHLRGRSCRPMPVQAAEHLLREREGLDRIEDVELEEAVGSDDGFVARFRTSAGRFEVRLAIDPGEPERLTCHSRQEERPPSYRALAIERR